MIKIPPSFLLFLRPHSGFVSTNAFIDADLSSRDFTLIFPRFESLTSLSAAADEDHSHHSPQKSMRCWPVVSSETNELVLKVCYEDLLTANLLCS